jgi:putative ABC transport system substrate-binding protein
MSTGALESLASHADVLWGIADPVVLNSQTAQPILLFSLRNRIPFIGLSLTWVKAGALYALDRDYTDIGMQCGELALQVIQGKPAGTLPPAPPRKAVYSVNLKTAHQLKVEIPRDLVQGAQSVIE